jgi:hypothetical protein
LFNRLVVQIVAKVVKPAEPATIAVLLITVRPLAVVPPIASVAPDAVVAGANIVPISCSPTPVAAKAMAIIILATAVNPDVFQLSLDAS